VRGGVFICHASHDAATAQRIAVVLEEADVPCWIAPRDIEPGETYTQAILEALAVAPVVILVFSSATNRSPHVVRELETSVGRDARILPVRVEDVAPSPSLKYFIGTSQWLDAATNGPEVWEPLLVRAVRGAVADRGDEPAAETDRTADRTTPSTGRAVAAPSSPPPAAPRSRRRWLVVAATLVAVLVVAGVVVAVATGGGDDHSPAASSTGSSSASTSPSASATGPHPTAQGELSDQQQTLFKVVQGISATACFSSDPLTAPDSDEPLDGEGDTLSCELPLSDVSALVAHQFDTTADVEAAFTAYATDHSGGTTCAGGDFIGGYVGGQLLCSLSVSTSNGSLSYMAWTDSADRVYFEAYGPPGDLTPLIQGVFQPVCGCQAP
jgi:TIR domain